MQTSRTRSLGGSAAPALVLLVALVGCGGPGALVDTSLGSARLDVRHATPTEPSPLRGELPLGAEGQDRGLLLVPEGYAPGTPAALVVLLHGAGGSAEGILGLMRDEALATGTLVLAPKSQARSWDMLAGRKYGADRAFLEASLARVFREYSVDPERVTLSGFSDGATYALSIGLSNGDLFRRIAAFSPGGVAASELQGRPAIFISHGTQDPVLPVGGAQFIVEQLRKEDYVVDYREFEGKHAVPGDLAREAFGFLTGPAP